MALHGFSTATGMVVDASDGEEVLIGYDGEAMGGFLHEPLPEPLPSRRSGGRVPVVLGPIDGPPLPVSLTVAPHKVVGNLLPLGRLDKLFAEGRFNNEARSRLHEYSMQLPAGLPMLVEAELPTGYGVHLDLLSRHVNAAGAAIGRNFSLRLRLPKASE